MKKRITFLFLCAFCGFINIFSQSTKIDGVNYSVIDGTEKTCSAELDSETGKENSSLIIPNIIKINETNYTVVQIKSYCGYSKGNIYLKELSIPSSVTNIGIKNLSELKTINGLGDNIIELQKDCFSNCNSLRKIDLPKVETLPENCFGFCSSLVSANVPNVKIAGDKCFQGCSSLKEIYLPNAVKLGNQCFLLCI